MAGRHHANSKHLEKDRAPRIAPDGLRANDEAQSGQIDDLLRFLTDEPRRRSSSAAERVLSWVAPFVIYSSTVIVDQFARPRRHSHMNTTKKIKIPSVGNQSSEGPRSETSSIHLPAAFQGRSTPKTSIGPGFGRPVPISEDDTTGSLIA
jgi:hypothetical protein